MANDPAADPKTPENTPPAPTDPVAPPADGTGIAAGPAPQVLFTPDPAAQPVKPTTAKPGEELIGSWLSAHLHRADSTYAALVLALAFLLGSFAAANSDIYLQLATGRLLSEGTYQFGVDPFAYTTQASDGRPAVPWINHSWLFAWVSYLLYNLDPSGAVLVGLKAASIAGLGLLLLLMRPGNRHRWAGTLIVLLALLVMSPRFELQPVVVSLLFLGATMFILVRAGVFTDSAEGARPGWLWALPFLFALWVNLDSFFILGPLTVLFCWIGLLVGSGMGQKSAVCLRRLGTVLAIGVVACFANPQHYKAVIRMPPELGYLMLHTGNFWPESVVAGGRAYMDFHNANKRFDASGKQITAFSRTISPLSSIYLFDAARGKNVAGIGFFVLVVVVLASFFFGKPERSSTMLARIVPMAFFGILALMMTRLIPFFAIVGAVVALLNVQEHLARREEKDPALADEQNLWANMTRLATGFLLFGLFFLAWPGWINTAVGEFDSPRRVAWGVSENASLKSTVKYLEKMHIENKLDRCFNLSSDVANYGAWFAPGVSFFLDERFELFDRDAPLYNQLHRSLAAETPQRQQMDPLPVSFGDDFAKFGIDHVTGSGPLAQELTRTAWYGENAFMSIYADGKNFVLAWKEALQKKNLKDPIQDVTEQWQHEAFGKAVSGWPASAAPRETDPSFWHAYFFGQSQPPLAADEARLLLRYNELVRLNPPWKGMYLLANHIAKFIQPFGPNICALVSVQPMGRDLGDPAALMVGLRKIRQAVVENPSLARSYLTLADAYQSFEFLENHWTENRPRQPDFEIRINLLNVRRFQFIGALKQYVVLNPQDESGHFRIADYYYRQNYLDLALIHLRESIKLLENARNLKPELLNEKHRREEIAAEWKKKVDKRIDDLEQRTKEDPPVRKASKAALELYKEEEAGGKEIIHANMGLINAAQKILFDIPVEKLDHNSKMALMQLNLRFALQTGDLALMHKILPEKLDPKDPPFVHEYSFYLNAASGKYEEADKFLRELEKFYESQFKSIDLEGRKRIVAMLSFSQVGPEIVTFRFADVFFYRDFSEKMLLRYFIPRADAHLLRAVFALEVGNTVGARKLFQETLDLVGANMFYFDRPIAERYYELLK